MILETLMFGSALWAIIYITLGILIVPWEYRDEPLKFWFFAIFWMALPFLAERFREIPLEPDPVEGICRCKKRILQDAGGKHCSICGGKIKDKLWKR